LTGWVNARTIVEGKEYEAQRDLIFPNVRRFDEVTRGIYWALSTRPETFPVAYVSPQGEEIRVLKTDAFTSIPRFRIFFKFDNSRVLLLWIEVI
jgi:hypothetical protein